MFARTDSEFPYFASVLWIFGPIDWWSYITPLALGIAAAASLRSPVRAMMLGVILGSSVIQAFVLATAAEPYLKFTSMLGSPGSVPYPIAPLVTNLALVGISLGIALYSVSKMLVRRRTVGFSEDTNER